MKLQLDVLDELVGQLAVLEEEIYRTWPLRFGDWILSRPRHTASPIPPHILVGTICHVGIQRRIPSFAWSLWPKASLRALQRALDDHGVPNFIHRQRRQCLIAHVVSSMRPCKPKIDCQLLSSANETTSNQWTHNFICTFKLQTLDATIRASQSSFEVNTGMLGPQPGGTSRRYSERGIVPPPGCAIASVDLATGCCSVRTVAKMAKIVKLFSK